MRKKRKIYGVMLLIVALLIMQIPVSEADASTSASDFQIDGTTLVKYTGSSEKVRIPTTIDTIGEGAFENNTKLKQIQITDSVKNIEEYAFWGCTSLEEISFGDGLTKIGDYTFTGCKGLETVVIPDNITEIGIQAFADCVNMTDITIPPSVLTIHESAFDGCAKLTIHATPGSAAEEYVKQFVVKQAEMPEYEDVDDYPSEGEGTASTENADGSEAGSTDGTGSGLTGDNGEAGNTGESGDSAASESTGKLLGSTQVVGNQAVVFIDNREQQVTVGMPEPPQQSQGTVGIDGTPLENTDSIAVEKGGSIPKYTIVDRVRIADQAYYRNKELTSVTLPVGLQEIGQFAFARSTVSELSLPEGLQTIGYGAFYHCDNLQYAAIPSSVQRIEPKAFEHTAWVEQFMKNGTSDYLISGDVLVAYRGTGAKASIPEGVRLIAAGAMAGHSEITGVTLPDSLEIIGEGAFEGCTSLSTVNGGVNVKKIQDRAFSGCPLSSVRIVDTVEEIGLGAFDSGEAVVFHGTVLPTLSYENTATRLSNESYRRPALDGIPFAVVDAYIDQEQIEGSVLASGMAAYRGVICSVGEDGKLHCRFSTLSEEELLRLAIPDTVEVYGTEYEVTDKDKIETLIIEETPITAGMVQVTGTVAWVQAALDGGGAGYELRIEEAQSKQVMEQAYQRIYHTSLPADAYVYDMTLMDEEKIPITKLGKQSMTITFPVPAALQNQDVQVLTVDRDGQLEAIPSEMVQTENGMAVRFTTNHFSPYAFYGKGTMYTEAVVVDGQAVVTSYGKKDDTPDTGDYIHPKWFLGFGLLFVSIAMIVSWDARKLSMVITGIRSNKKE